MAGKKTPASRDKPDKSSSKPKAKGGTSNDVKGGKKKAQEFNPQKLPATAGPPRFELFLKLPLEIRQMVYGFTLTETQQPVVVDRWNDKGPGYFYPNLSYPKLNLDLMGVNHQIRSEVDQQYYSLNDFRFLQPDDVLISWLRDRNRRDPLRSLACRLEADDNSYDVLKLLSECKQLKRLTIAAHSNTFSIFAPNAGCWGLHGFQSAEAIVVPFADPDDGYIGSSWTNGNIVPAIHTILGRLTRGCPQACRGHARRERVEVRVWTDIDPY